MKIKVALHILSIAALGGCGSMPPQAYHDIAQHPLELRQNSVIVSLVRLTPAQAAAAAREGARTRANAGSRFSVVADPAVGRAVHDALIAAGVAPADIQVSSATSGAALTRFDVVAIPSGCSGEPVSISGIGRLDDGFGHDNANSALLGCAVQRNIAAMLADPRELAAPAAFGGRDGARSAEIYGKWTRGQPTTSQSILPSEKIPSGGGN